MSYDQEGQFKSKAGFNRHDNLTASSFPNKCVGAIYQGTVMIGTGFLVGSDLILTSAFNIRDKSKQEDRQNLIFYPGITGKLNSGYKIVSYRYNKEYLSTETINYDFALAKLEKKVRYKQFIQLGANYNFEKQVLGLIGYRSLSCDDKNADQSSSWWSKEDRIEDSQFHSTKDQYLFHKLSTHKGVSGSPLLVKRNNKNIAIGIHLGVSKNENSNIGRLITEDILLDIICWEKQMASQIKFCMMKDKKFSHKTVRVMLCDQSQPSYQALKEKIIKLEQQKEQKYERYMQGERKWFGAMVEELQRIPQKDKKEITSLTLKVTMKQKRVLMRIVQAQIFYKEEYDMGISQIL